MRLTDHTDYALRVLMYLGANPDRIVTIREIAAAHGISHNHLTKIVHRLGQQGLLFNSRGRSGGIQLGQPAERIMIGSVIRMT
ncbi:MAG: RrF2 family transcriptional regulator, partial [Gammaproteobacteria bacterium]